MIQHELITPAPINSGVASIIWNLTAGKRFELDTEGGLVREGLGPLVVEGGVEGLGHPQFEVNGKETPRVHGRRRTGLRAKARKCFLPVFLDAEGADWAEIYRLFWACVTPASAILWRVTTPNGQVRELSVVLDPQGGSYDTDPTLSFENEPLDFVADDPFWRGLPQVALLAVADDGTPFLGAEGTAPPFHIQSSSANGTNRFIVDGDLEAWPRLELVGPIPVWSVSTKDGQTVGGLPLLEGDRVVIDFDPTGQVAIRTRGGVDTNVTDQLPQAGFFRLVADSLGGMEIETFMSGSGSLKFTYQPRFWRAV